jgi:murein DD-endopeptidase MepM/ murein hydrolase activator NlpD
MRDLLLLAAVTALALVAPASVAQAAWERPVPGEVVRGFAYGGDPFAAGQRRGVVLRAPADERVVAACAGRIVFAGRVARRDVVSVRCGRWHVAYGGVRTALREGAAIRRGALLGRIAGRRGLHLSVRRAADRFAYVDPAALLAPPPLPPPPAAAPVRPSRPQPPAPSPVRPRPPARVTPREPSRVRPVAPAPVTPREPAPAPAGGSAPSSAPLAPWPVWLGLALLLAGATTGGVATGRRRARARTAAWRLAAAQE